MRDGKHKHGSYLWREVQECAESLLTLTDIQARIVLYLLYYRVRYDSECKISQAQIANDMGIDLETVRRGVKKLQKIGCLDWIPSSGSIPCQYLIRIQSLFTCLDEQKKELNHNDG